MKDEKSPVSAILGQTFIKHNFKYFKEQIIIIIQLIK